MKTNQIGSFRCKIIGAEYTRNTNYISKMNPYFTIHQDPKIKKKKAKLLGPRKLFRSHCCKKGHKKPVWNTVITIPDFADYDPVYYIKSKNRAAMTSEFIGMSKIYLEPYREIGLAENVEYKVVYEGKLVGVLKISIKYQPRPGVVFTHHKEEAKAQTDLDYDDQVISSVVASGGQTYDEYTPMDAIDESHSSDENDTAGGRNIRSSITTPELVFKPKSYQILQYQPEVGDYIDISVQTQILHPDQVEATRLPDDSYLLTGGIDAQSGDFTSIVAHYLNGQYYPRAEIMTPRVGHCTVYNKGFVYCFGGYNNSGVLNKAEAHDMNSDCWLELPDMLTARYDMDSYIEDDYIYLIGGKDTINGSHVSTIEKFNINTNTFEIVDR